MTGLPTPTSPGQLIESAMPSSSHPQSSTFLLRVSGFGQLAHGKGLGQNLKPSTPLNVYVNPILPLLKHGWMIYFF